MEYTFGEFVFTEADEYELCYMYSSANLPTMALDETSFYKVSGVVVSVNTVLGVASVSKGVTTGFVADYEKDITFTLVEHTVMENSFYAVSGQATSCSEQASMGMNVTALSSSSFRVTFTNVDLEATQPLQLCFCFGNYPAQLYPSITFKVAELFGLTGNLVDEDGYLDQAVVDGTKPLSIYGMQLATGDYIKFIGNDEDCDTNTGFGRRLDVIQPEDDSNASMVTCPAGSALCQATMHFSRESMDDVHACYWFSNDPGYWKSYPYSLRVTQPGDLLFTSVEGLNDRGLVAGSSKTFHIRGNGASYGDTVYLVQDQQSCVEENAWDSRVFHTEVTELDNVFAVIVSMEYLTPGSNLRLCYQFSSLPAFNDKVSGLFHINAITGIDSELTSGSTSIAIAGMNKNYYILGIGFSMGDQVAWITGEETCSESQHMSALLMDTENAAYYSPVLFTSAEAGKTFRMCYKFAYENWMEYPSITVMVKQYGGVGMTSVGASDTLVLNSEKTFFLDDTDSSYGYSEGDMVYLVNSGDDCSNSANYLYSAPVVASVSSTPRYQFTLELGESFAGKTCRICYAFGDEVAFATSDVLRVKGMTGFVGVLDVTTIDTEQSVTSVVLNVEKKLVFPSNMNIDYTDRFLFVESQSECASASALLPLNLESMMLYVTVLRTNPLDVGKTFYGCMKFGSEPNTFLPAVTLQVKSFNGMETTQGANDVLVLSQAKTFDIDMTGGAGEGDAVIIAPSSCTDVNAPNRLVFPVVKNGDKIEADRS